jgi:hypothetical protein
MTIPSIRTITPSLHSRRSTFRFCISDRQLDRLVPIPHNLVASLGFRGCHWKESLDGRPTLSRRDRLPLSISLEFPFAGFSYLIRFIVLLVVRRTTFEVQAGMAYDVDLR